MSLLEGVIQKPFLVSIKRSWQDRLNGLLSSLALIWLAIAGYRLLSYYKGYLSTSTEKALLYIALAYSLGAILFYLAAPLAKVKQSKSLLTVVACQKIVLGIKKFMLTGPRDYTHPLVSLTKEEKRAVLFNLVKLFFIPLMISFLIGNYAGLKQNYQNVGSMQELFSIDGFNTVLYPLLFSLFLLVDTAFFAFGYLVEADVLKNKIRSVEPTVLGWAVALVCYPPFNGVLGNYLNWYANDYASLSTSKGTFFMRLFSLAFMGIYASASVALGSKASNLTNRGIVGYGPYRIVRHPAYICKNIAWWITILPVISAAAVLSMSVWSAIYFMRAITEERHLSADPDYLAYCKKVKYRFIPGVV